MSDQSNNEVLQLNIDYVTETYGLTIKQAFFCEYYLQTYNGTKAARLAGYAHPVVEGSRLLGNANIRKYLDKRFAERTMTANEVLDRLTNIARADIGDYLKVANDKASDAKVAHEGKILPGIYIDLEQAIKDGNTSRIKSFKRSIKDGTVIELHDPMKALELIGKHNRLFADVMINSDKGDNTAASASDEKLERIINEDDDRDTNDNH